MRQVFSGWGVAAETKSSSYDMESAPVAAKKMIGISIVKGTKYASDESFL